MKLQKIGSDNTKDNIITGKLTNIITITGDKDVADVILSNTTAKFVSDISDPFVVAYIKD